MPLLSPEVTILFRPAPIIGTSGQTRLFEHAQVLVLYSQLIRLCSIHGYSPHGRSLEFPRGRGVLRAKLLEEEYEVKLEFPGGGGRGGAKQKTFCGGVWIFSGTTHLSERPRIKQGLQIHCWNRPQVLILIFPYLGSWPQGTRIVMFYHNLVFHTKK